MPTKTQRTVNSIKELEHYRYKLNENEPNNFKSIYGIQLSHGWKTFDTRQKKLDNLIRSKTNSKGIIDYEIYIPASGKVLKSSLVGFKKEVRIYSKDVITTMKRDTLEEICTIWEIDPKHKKDDFLIKLIIEAQENHKKKKAVTKEKSKFQEEIESEKSEPEITEKESKEEEQQQEKDAD